MGYRHVPTRFINGHPQRAIPWCVTHDAIALQIPGPYTVCRAGVDMGDHGNCAISKGGPDHRWWEDTE